MSLNGRAIALGLGASHSCAVLEGGALFCWGNNGVGQLGLGHARTIGDGELPVAAARVPLSSPVAEVAAGTLNTCALLVSGALECWGDARHEVLPENVPATLAVPNPVVALPVLLAGSAAAVAVGTARVCAVYGDGKVRCRGNNSKGQLGRGDATALPRGKVSEALEPVDLGTSPVSRLVAGDEHTCALLTDGTLRCWGENAAYQLGYDTSRRIGDDETPSEAGPVPVFGVRGSGWTFVNPYELRVQVLVEAVSPVAREVQLSVSNAGSIAVHDIRAVYLIDGVDNATLSLDTLGRSAPLSKARLQALKNGHFPAAPRYALEFDFSGNVLEAGRTTVEGVVVSEENSRVARRSPPTISLESVAAHGPVRLQLLEQNDNVIFGWIRSAGKEPSRSARAIGP